MAASESSDLFLPMKELVPRQPPALKAATFTSPFLKNLAAKPWLSPSHTATRAPPSCIMANEQFQSLLDI